METTILTLALTIIREVVKNPKKRARLKGLMLKMRDAIDAAFAEA
ncbi:MAG TPA: hypothetical protein VI699_02045 [Candidatus Acidoferrales bacterium]|jgi:hypothetical protein|nr:hypothetical protein [Candidatus Acidoferrales bacterium]